MSDSKESQRRELAEAVSDATVSKLQATLADLLLRVKAIETKMDGALSAAPKAKKSVKTTATESKDAPAANGAANGSAAKEELPSNSMNYFKQQYTKGNPEATKFWEGDKHEKEINADAKYKSYKDKKDGSDDKKKQQADFLWNKSLSKEVKDKWSKDLKDLKDKNAKSAPLSADKS
jgi:hypothetical protein